MAYSADKQNRKKNLPAPYVNPWNELRKNIFAIFSDSQLRMREIFRRNLEGDLPCPDFWPSQLKQVFWPLKLYRMLLKTFN